MTKIPANHPAAKEAAKLEVMRTGLAVAVERGERPLLVAMRLKLAKLLDDGVPASTVVPMMQLLLQVDRAIRQLDAAGRGTGAHL